MVDCAYNLQVSHFFFIIPKDAQFSETGFLSFVFMQILVFQIWSILYSIFVAYFFYVREASPPKPPLSWGLSPLHPTPGALPAGPGYFWIESPQPTGYRYDKYAR